ncbi:superoxide dismutase, Fe-Mn family [Acrasis kona]|uniref:Superoxide dismutase n=1 Tax=Acrasis kona TaxID=1008807 RepID=A0AAW2ZK17_9EUKA
MKRLAILVLLISSILCLDENIQPDVLTYTYDALEPYIDTKTVTIHHDGHHQAYADNLSNALKSLRQAGQGDLIDSCAQVRDLLTRLDEVKDETLRKQIRNNGGGLINHNLFWKVMSGEGHSQPSKSMTEVLNKKFGSIEQFKDSFSQQAIKLFGSGWVFLIKNSKGDLSIESFPNQDNPFITDKSANKQPILGIDVWEHSYYLKYQNKRAAYVKEWWNVVDWVQVSSLYFDSTHSDEL